MRTITMMPNIHMSTVVIEKELSHWAVECETNRQVWDDMRCAVWIPRKYQEKQQSLTNQKKQDQDPYTFSCPKQHPTTPTTNNQFCCLVEAKVQMHAIETFIYLHGIQSPRHDGIHFKTWLRHVKTLPGYNRTKQIWNYLVALFFGTRFVAHFLLGSFFGSLILSEHVGKNDVLGQKHIFYLRKILNSYLKLKSSILKSVETISPRKLPNLPAT